jgi:hypothetical protein
MPIANCVRPRVAAAHLSRASGFAAAAGIAAAAERSGAAGTILPPATAAGT